MATGGFGSLGEFAHGEGGYSVGALVRPGVIESTAAVLPAQIYAGQYLTRTTIGAWGDGALGEFAHGEGPETVNNGAELAPGVVEATAELLTPSLRSGASAMPGVLDTTNELPTPLVSAGARLDPPLVAATAEILTPIVSAGASLFPGVLESSAELVDATTTTGASDRPGFLTSTAEILTPLVSAGASVLPGVLESTAEVLPAATNIGVVLFPGTITAATAEIFDVTLLGGVSVLPVPVVSTSSGAWGDGALGEFAHGEGEPGTAYGQVLTGHAAVLAPSMRSGASILPGVIETTNELPTPLVSAGARLDPGTITAAASELFDPTIQIGAALLPDVVTAAQSVTLVPMVSAGKSLFPPALTGSAVVLSPEINARRRLWVQAIAC